MTTETTTEPQDEQQPEEKDVATSEKSKAPAPDDQKDVAQQDPKDGKSSEDEDDEKGPVDWATLTKVRSEASNLRRRLRGAEEERDQARERIDELESQVQKYQQTQQQGEVDGLRRRMLTERGLPESALDLITGTSEEEISQQLDRVGAVISAPDTDGLALHGTRGQPAPSGDWSSVVKNR